MPVDVEKLRHKIGRLSHVARLSILGTGFEFISPKEALEMVEEIEGLRAKMTRIQEIVGTFSDFDRGQVMAHVREIVNNDA